MLIAIYTNSLKMFIGHALSAADGYDHIYLLHYQTSTDDTFAIIQLNLYEG